MYNRSAKYYDKIYSWKNYRAESAKIRRFIQRFKKSHGKDLLDVACGTGNHITYLKKWFNVAGLDNNPYMLKQARLKHPKVRFYNGDMTHFNLKSKLDIVTCLFSAIGHLKNTAQLNSAIHTMAEHLKVGGLLVLEPSFRPEVWKRHYIGADFVNEPELKIARISLSDRKGSTAILNMHHLIGTPNGIQYFLERGELQLFKQTDYLDAFHNSGLDLKYNRKGLEGRGLYLGLKPLR